MEAKYLRHNKNNQNLKLEVSNGASLVDNRPVSSVFQRYSNDNSSSNNKVIQRLHGSFDNANYGAAVTTTRGVQAAAAALVPGALPSHILRASLVGDSNLPDSNDEIDMPNNQAHHIVESNDANALHSRRLMAAAGIDLDSAVNGVLLPSEASDDGGGAAIHLGSHIAEYAIAVNSSLDAALIANPPAAGWPGGNVAGILVASAGALWAGSANQTHMRAVLVNRLVAIRRLLLEDGVALNARGDGEWGETLTDAFRAAGLL